MSDADAGAISPTAAPAAEVGWSEVVRGRRSGDGGAAPGVAPAASPPAGGGGARVVNAAPADKAASAAGATGGDGGGAKRASPKRLPSSFVCFAMPTIVVPATRPSLPVSFVCFADGPTLRGFGVLRPSCTGSRVCCAVVLITLKVGSYLSSYALNMRHISNFAISLHHVINRHTTDERLLHHVAWGPRKRSPRKALGRDMPSQGNHARSPSVLPVCHSDARCLIEPTRGDARNRAAQDPSCAPCACAVYATASRPAAQAPSAGMARAPRSPHRRRADRRGRWGSVRSPRAAQSPRAWRRS